MLNYKRHHEDPSLNFLIEHNAMKNWVTGDRVHVFLTSALDGVKQSGSQIDYFSPDVNPQYPVKRRLSEPQIQSGYGGEEKKSHHYA
jgi:hypothetical protein